MMVPPSRAIMEAWPNAWSKPSRMAVDAFAWTLVMCRDGGDVVVVVKTVAEAEHGAGDQRDFERSSYTVDSAYNVGMISRDWAS